MVLNQIVARVDFHRNLCVKKRPSRKKLLKLEGSVAQIKLQTATV